jgi:hypothetical protein
MNNQFEFSGFDLGRQGMELAAARAGPIWAEAAFDRLASFARGCAYFTTEQMKAWAYAQGLVQPENESAWGGVVVRAKRERIIRFVDYVPAEQSSRHGAPNRRWQSLVYGGGNYV